MRDSIAMEPGRSGPTDAPGHGIKRSFEQARPAVAATAYPSISPQCSSPCHTLFETPDAARTGHVMNADTCRSSLGDRTFAILRNAMLQQQETFLEQLWELHKLARTQGRKAAVLATDVQLVPAQGEGQAMVLNPQQQLHLHQMTMQAILGMQTIPASLRQPVIVAGPDPTERSELVSQQNAANKTSTAETHAAPAAAQVLNCQPAQDPASEAYPSQVMMCPMGNMPYGHQSIGCAQQHGYGLHGDPNAVPFHWPGGPQYAGAALPAFHPGALPFGSMPPAAAQFLQGLPVPSGPLSHCAPSYAAAHTQSTGPESGNSQSPAQLQPTESQPRQMDVSSLLGMVAPGIIAQPDLHSQWFSKNMAGGSGPQDMSAALLGMQTTMDAAPEPPLADNGFASEATRSTLSNSMWSGNTLVMPPGMQPMQAQLNQVNDIVVPNTVPASTAQPPPSRAGLLAQPARMADAARKSVSAGVAADRSVETGAFHREMAGQGTKTAGKGRTCQTDESAASILMSLKASS